MDMNIADLIEKASKKYATNVAFEDVNKKITYEELWIQAQQIATRIIDNVDTGMPVVILMEKSVEAIEIMCGIIAVGGVYSFIDVNQPMARIQHIMDTLDPALIISDIVLDGLQVSEKCVVLKRQCLFEYIANSSIDRKIIEERRKKIVSTQPLYINFTSGSTGIPKGVAISHASVLDFIPNFVEVMGISESDILGNQAPMDFDVSVKDFYSAFFTGAKVILIPREYFIKPQVLMDYICDNKMTVLIWAVSALCFITTMRGLEYRCPEELRIIGFSGEVMPLKQLEKLRRFLTDTRFINLYGPTEITCNCTYYEIGEEDFFDDKYELPIGKNFKNNRVFLLSDKDKQISEDEVGEVGEICVAGPEIALGYYNDIERTIQTFVQNPTNKLYRDIIYRTGDLGRYNNSGCLIYVGRKDSQIKHLGHRIELGEIESIMLGVSGIERAVCLYNHEKNKLTLFYTGEAKKDMIVDEAKKVMPSYMIPNKFTHLDGMPLNTHGKVDRKKLGELL